MTRSWPRWLRSERKYWQYLRYSYPTCCVLSCAADSGAVAVTPGGGVSTVFPLPAWQNGLQLTRSSGGTAPLLNRGTPDVSGDADGASGWQVRVDGQNLFFFGTSAVAPLWAGLIARINATRGGPVGFINAVLYANPSALRDILQGNNGSFTATKGWDACTGLGSPNGAAVAALFGHARTS